MAGGSLEGTPPNQSETPPILVLACFSKGVWVEAFRWGEAKTGPLRPALPSPSDPTRHPGERRDPVGGSRVPLC